MLTPQIPPHNIDKTELSLLLALVTEKTMFTALGDSGEEKQRQKWVFQCGDLIKMGKGSGLNSLQFAEISRVFQGRVSSMLILSVEEVNCSFGKFM